MLARLRCWVSSERGDWAIQWAGVTLVVLTLIVGSWVYIEKEGKGPIGAVASAYMQAQIDCWEGKPCFEVEYQEGKIDFPLEPCPYLVCEAPPVEPPPEPIAPPPWEPFIRWVGPPLQWLGEIESRAAERCAVTAAGMEAAWAEIWINTSASARQGWATLWDIRVRPVQYAQGLFAVLDEFTADWARFSDMQNCRENARWAILLRGWADDLPEGDGWDELAGLLYLLAEEKEHQSQLMLDLLNLFIIHPAEGVLELLAVGSEANPMNIGNTCSAYLASGLAGIARCLQDVHQDTLGVLSGGRAWSAVVAIVWTLAALIAPEVALVGGLALGVGFLGYSGWKVLEIMLAMRDAGSRSEAISIALEHKGEFRNFALSIIMVGLLALPTKGVVDKWVVARNTASVVRAAEAALTPEAIAIARSQLAEPQRMALYETVRTGRIPLYQAEGLLESLSAGRLSASATESFLASLNSGRLSPTVAGTFLRSLNSGRLHAQDADVLMGMMARGEVKDAVLATVLEAINDPRPSMWEGLSQEAITAHLQSKGLFNLAVAENPPPVAIRVVSGRNLTRHVLGGERQMGNYDGITYFTDISELRNSNGVFLSPKEIVEGLAIPPTSVDSGDSLYGLIFSTAGRQVRPGSPTGVTGGGLREFMTPNFHYDPAEIQIVYLGTVP